MNLINIFRKLGILRYGAKSATYTNAVDRPAEFMMDGVFNADKDLTTRQDFQQAATALGGVPPSSGFCAQCGTALKSETKFCSTCGTAVGGGAPEVPTPSAGRRKGCLTCGVVLGIIAVFFLLLCYIVADVPKPDVGLQSVAAPVKVVDAIPSEPSVTIVPAAKAAGNDRIAAQSVAVKPEVERSQTPSERLAAWTPASNDEATSGPPWIKYANYINSKYGFLAELPAHWESSVVNGLNVFTSPGRFEDSWTRVSFQVVVKKPGSTLKSQAESLVAQFKTMNDFILDSTDEQELNGYRLNLMFMSYTLPDGQQYRQMEAVVDHGDAHYLLIAYAAPAKVFNKYSFVMARVLDSLRFGEL